MDKHAPVVYFADIASEALDGNLTLPAKFKRMLKKFNLPERIKGKSVAVKMHLGGGIGYTTVHPFFVRTLVDELREAGARQVKIMDGDPNAGVVRGYVPQVVNCPIVSCFGETGKYLYKEKIGYKGLDEALFGSISSLLIRSRDAVSTAAMSSDASIPISGTRLAVLNPQQSQKTVILVRKLMNSRFSGLNFFRKAAATRAIPFEKFANLLPVTFIAFSGQIVSQCLQYVQWCQKNVMIFFFLIRHYRPCSAVFPALQAELAFVLIVAYPACAAARVAMGTLNGEQLT